jgi:hypothetical protein
MDLARFAEVKYRAENCSIFLEGAKIESRLAYRSCLSRLRELLGAAKINAKSG